MLLLYQIIITITCWHQLFQITSLFNQFTSLLALNCRSEWQERMYIYKWHEVDQTKHEIFCSYCLQWNTSQSKFRNHYFFFYLRFPYCPNFFWFGVVLLLLKNLNYYSYTLLLLLLNEGFIQGSFLQKRRKKGVPPYWVWRRWNNTNNA